MNIYKNLIRPLMFRLPSESAHELGIYSLRFALGASFVRNLAAKGYECSEFGELKRFGLTFSNPLGLAAGFDKNARVTEQITALGFGCVEVGTVTFNSQPGNPRPRMFRLQSDQALINRLGFNNDGAKVVVERLRKIRKRGGIIGINIGKNKDVPNELAIENYLASFEKVFDAADYIAVNVSSPNTPNLRELQQEEKLESLLGALMEKNRELARDSGVDSKPILVKIAPDLSDSEIEAIVDICLRLGLAGIIATNTTISREGLKASQDDIRSIGQGGLSGRPLYENSTCAVKTIYRYSHGKLPIIGVGGIFTAEDAFEKIAAGACLVQAYTGFVYNGISFARDINRGLAQILRKRGFGHLDEAIGSGV